MVGKQKLAAFIEAAGITQLQFAQLAGVPGPQVSMWLSGKRRPGLRSAFKIQAATNGRVPADSWVERRRSPRSV